MLARPKLWQVACAHSVKIDYVAAWPVGGVVGTCTTQHAYFEVALEAYVLVANTGANIRSAMLLVSTVTVLALSMWPTANLNGRQHGIEYLRSNRSECGRSEG